MLSLLDITEMQLCTQHSYSVSFPILKHPSSFVHPVPYASRLSLGYYSLLAVLIGDLANTSNFFTKQTDYRCIYQISGKKSRKLIETHTVEDKNILPCTSSIGQHQLCSDLFCTSQLGHSLKLLDRPLRSKSHLHPLPNSV